jgi:hypothetical protein
LDFGEEIEMEMEMDRAGGGDGDRDGDGPSRWRRWRWFLRRGEARGGISRDKPVKELAARDLLRCD